MSTLGEKLNAFRLNGGQLCDVTLIACDSNVGLKCHKLVLMASSDYFFNMFTSGMQESRAASAYFADCRLEVLQILVEFFYTSEPPSGVTCDNVLELFSWAIRCECAPLRRHCCKFITNTLGCDNVLSVYAFAVAHNLDEVRAQCLQFMQNNYEEMVESNMNEWLSVSRETVQEVISSDYLRVRNEDAILRHLVLWSDRHPEHRDILSHIRTNYLSKQMLDDYKDLLEEVGAIPSRQLPRRYVSQHLHVILQSHWDLSKLFVVCCSKTGDMLYRTPELPLETQEDGEGFRVAFCSTLSDGALWCICSNQYLYRYNHTTSKMHHHKTVRRDASIVHMAPIQDVLYSIVRLQAGGQMKLEMFLASLFRWRTFISLNEDAYRIVPTETDYMYILGKTGSIARVIPSKVMRAEQLGSNPQTDWEDCEAVALPTGLLLVHGRDHEEFTTFEFDPRSLAWTLLCTHRRTMVTSYQLFLCDMEAYLAEESERSLTLYRWMSGESANRWELVRNLEHDYGHFIGPVYRNRCTRDEPRY